MRVSDSASHAIRPGRTTHIGRALDWVATGITVLVDDTSPRRKLANAFPQEPNDGEFGWLVVKLLKLKVPARPPLNNRSTLISPSSPPNFMVCLPTNQVRLCETPQPKSCQSSSYARPRLAGAATPPL